jgi:hypothetical protein
MIVEQALDLNERLFVALLLPKKATTCNNVRFGEAASQQLIDLRMSP